QTDLLTSHERGSNPHAIQQPITANYSLQPTSTGQTYSPCNLRFNPRTAQRAIFLVFHTRASLQVRPSASLCAVRAAPVPVRLDVSPTHPCTLVGHRT